MNQLITIIKHDVFGAEGRKTLAWTFIAGLLIIACEVWIFRSLIDSEKIAANQEALQTLSAIAVQTGFELWIGIWGLVALGCTGVLQNEIKQRTIFVTLIRVPRWKYYFGNLIGILILLIANVVIAVGICFILGRIFGVSLSRMFYVATLYTGIRYMVAISLAVALSAILLKRLTWVIFLGITSMTSLATLYDSKIAAVDGGLSFALRTIFYLMPATLKEDLIRESLVVARLHAEYGFYLTVCLENFLYVCLLGLVGYAIFRQKEIAAASSA